MGRFPRFLLPGKHILVDKKRHLKNISIWTGHPSRCNICGSEESNTGQARGIAELNANIEPCKAVEIVHSEGYVHSMQNCHLH